MVFLQQSLSISRGGAIPLILAIVIVKTKSQVLFELLCHFIPIACRLSRFVVSIFNSAFLQCGAQRINSLAPNCWKGAERIQSGVRQCSRFRDKRTATPDRRTHFPQPTLLAPFTTPVGRQPFGEEGVKFCDDEFSLTMARSHRSASVVPFIWL